MKMVSGCIAGLASWLLRVRRCVWRRLAGLLWLWRIPAALTQNLVEGDRASHRCVQRADVPAHRQPNELVAVLARQAADAFRLVADHQGDWPLQIRLVIGCLGVAVQPDTPDALAFQIVQ